MTRILLTNDDGVDSPALVPFARALLRRHEVEVVVPDTERSWIGKAMTRHEPVRLDRAQRDGVPVWVTTGTPADATQLGVHALPRPDVVVSGINLGYNHSTAFLMSSGTVGAAIEAHLTGTVGIAFSAGATTDWHTWRPWAETSDAQPGWERLATLCVDLLDEVLASGLPAHADAVSVNLPFDADHATPRRVTTIARSRYGRVLFPGEDGVHVHALRGVESDEVDDASDLAASRDGVVAITPIRLPAAPAVPAAVRSSLERP